MTVGVRQGAVQKDASVSEMIFIVAQVAHETTVQTQIKVKL